MPKRQAANPSETEARRLPENERTPGRPFVVLVLVLLALIGANVFALDIRRLGRHLRLPRAGGGERGKGIRDGETVGMGNVGQGEGGS